MVTPNMANASVLAKPSRAVIMRVFFSKSKSDEAINVKYISRVVKLWEMDMVNEAAMSYLPRPGNVVRQAANWRK